MVDNQRAMYDRFSDKSAHFAEWDWNANDFLYVAFSSGRYVAKCPYKKCQNYKMLSWHDV
jgi:hypothetical protein